MDRTTAELHREVQRLSEEVRKLNSMVLSVKFLVEDLARASGPQEEQNTSEESKEKGYGEG